MAEILGALAGLGGAALGAQSQGEAAVIQLLNLRFQQENARRQFDLATSTRTDAYGNKQQYDPLTNSWKTVLSPTQGQIVKAGETEQLKSLTTDAARNRAILEEQRARGEEAKPDYTKALAGFRYDQPPSRAADEDKLLSLMQMNNQSQASGDQSTIARTLLRQGRGGDISAVFKASNDSAGRNLGPNIAQAYRESIPQYTSSVSQHQSQYLPVLQQLQQTMAGGGGAPARFSTTPQELSALQSEQNRGVFQALQNQASNVGGAYNSYAKSIADTAPDLKGLAALISGVSKSGGGKAAAPQASYSLLPPQVAAASDVGGGDAGFGNYDPQMDPSNTHWWDNFG